MDRKPPAGNDPVSNVPMLLDVAEMRRVLGSNLRDTREAACLSQRELGEICIIPRTTVGRVERGEQEVKLSTLALFSLAMRVPLTASLLAGVDEWLLDLLPPAP